MYNDDVRIAKDTAARTTKVQRSRGVKVISCCLGPNL